MLTHHVGTGFHECVLEFQSGERFHDLLDIAFLDLGEIWFDNVRSRTFADQCDLRLLVLPDGRSMHGDSVPHDSNLFLCKSVLFQKVSSGFRPLNLERRIPLEAFRQTQVMQNAGKVEDLFVELLPERPSDQ